MLSLSCDMIDSSPLSAESIHILLPKLKSVMNAHDYDSKRRICQSPRIQRVAEIWMDVGYRSGLAHAPEYGAWSRLGNFSSSNSNVSPATFDIKVNPKVTSGASCVIFSETSHYLARFGNIGNCLASPLKTTMVSSFEGFHGPLTGVSIRLRV